MFFAIVVFALSSKDFWRLFYPFPYRQTVEIQAKKNGLDPLLVAAVIRVESKFQAGAISNKGAIGLMQVMPQTGYWAAGEMGLPGFSVRQLANPSINLAIGTWYLARLHREFGGNLVQVLAAYNGGDHNVKKWLRTGRLDKISDIPFPETRNFVTKVLAGYVIYRRLY